MMRKEVIVLFDGRGFVVFLYSNPVSHLSILVCRCFCFPYCQLPKKGRNTSYCCHSFASQQCTEELQKSDRELLAVINDLAPSDPPHM